MIDSSQEKSEVAGGMAFYLFKSFLADRRSRQTPKPPGAPTGTQDPGPSHTLTILIALCRILHYQRILATVTTGGDVQGRQNTPSNTLGMRAALLRLKLL